MVFIDELPNTKIVKTTDVYAYDDLDVGVSVDEITKQSRPGQWQIAEDAGIDVVLEDSAVDNSNDVNLFQVRDINDTSFDNLKRFRIRPQGKMEQEPVQPQLVSNSITSGLASAIGPSYVSENRLYVSRDAGFTIYDVTVKNNPSLVREVTGVTPTPSYDISKTTAIQVHRNIIMTTFLGDQSGGSPPGGGILLYDAFDEAAAPSAFTLIEHNDATLGPVPTSLETVYDFASWGNFNFYPDFENSKITVMDFSDIFNPVLVTVYESGFAGQDISKPTAIDVSEGYLYWANTGDGDESIACVQIAGDGASPLTPKNRGSFDLSGGGNVQAVGTLQARGTHVLAGAGNNFITGDDRFLYSIDFNDPNTPVLSDKIEVSNITTQIQFDENIATVSSQAGITDNILTILDVSDLTDLKVIAIFDSNLAFDGLGHASNGNEIYLINSNGTINLAVIDIQGFKTQSIEAAQADFGTVNISTKLTTRRLEVTDNADFGAGGMSSAGVIRGGDAISTRPKTVTGNFTGGTTEFFIELKNDVEVYDIQLDQTEDIILKIPDTGFQPGHVAYVKVSALSGNTGIFQIDITNGQLVNVDTLNNTDLETQDKTFFITFRCINLAGVEAITYDIHENLSVQLKPGVLLAVTGSLQGEVDLAWSLPPVDNGSPPLTDYFIEYSIDNFVADFNTFAHGNTSVTETVTGLAAATVFFFRVSAINTIGTGPPSNIISAISGA